MRDNTVPLGTLPHTRTRRLLGLRPPVFALSREEAASHAHIIGVTKSGKSRFLARLYLDLLYRGLPATFIDPHGDTARLILAHLVASGVYRHPTGADASPYQRVIYLDLPAAARAQRYLPFNVLAAGGSPHDTAKNVLDAFHRAWPSLGDGVAPRFDKLVQNGIKVLISNGLPLPALYRFLTDRAFRDQLLAAEADPDVVALWRDEYNRLPEKQQLEYADSTLSRVNLLVFDPVLKYSLAQSTSRLNFRSILDAGRSVIVNLALPSKDTRRLLGCLLTVAAEQGAFSRAELPPGTRFGSHHLIIDEFADFTAQSEEALTTMLSQTRKYGLFLVMAHQTWSQASSRLRGAMQNAAIEVVFRIGREDAEHAATKLGRVNPLAVKHTAPDPAAEARSHPVFYPLAEQWETWVQSIQDLKRREAYIRTPSGVNKITTLPCPDPAVLPDELAAVEQTYLASYFRSQAEIQQDLASYRPAQPPRRTTRRGPLKDADAA